MANVLVKELQDPAGTYRHPVDALVKDHLVLGKLEPAGLGRVKVVQSGGTAGRDRSATVAVKGSRALASDEHLSLRCTSRSTRRICSLGGTQGMQFVGHILRNSRAVSATRSRGYRYTLSGGDPLEIWVKPALEVFAHTTGAWIWRGPASIASELELPADHTRSGAASGFVGHYRQVNVVDKESDLCVAD